MKLKFKHQEYQEKAVDAVINCFEGQTPSEGLRYQIDPGIIKGHKTPRKFSDFEGFKNAEISLSNSQLLENIQRVQRNQNLPQSEKLDAFKKRKKGKLVSVGKKYSKNSLAATGVHLDVEMETGTGKTYCYIKTIFEMYQKFGWSKFIVVVPSVAIREGVTKSLEITAEHFHQDYGEKIRFFSYDSSRLHEIESFSSDAKINVMIINSQAFYSPPKKGATASYRSQARFKIYREMDEFQSRRPIDVIAANRPILILDEPQKLQGAKTLRALTNFNPLMILRYSATHKVRHNLIHRLDAVDAFNQKLVKKIAVRGIETRGQGGTSAYLYLQDIDISPSRIAARVEIEIKQKSGAVVRRLRTLQKGDNLFDLSNELDQYRDRFVVNEIDVATDTIEFENGTILRAGEAHGDVDEAYIRRIQIRETIQAHLAKERELFDQGVKVLSLFFIDKVAHYRDYDQPDDKGSYARVFEEEYESARQDILDELPLDSPAYRRYLKEVSAEQVHNGYFSIDNKGRLVDTSEKSNQSARAQQETSYNLIMKDKERLLSFEEPTRFIFSHSALREGWDNPNIFAICTLKYSENTISRRQEVGRGLRISVDQSGSRTDSNKATVHDINVLTVVANESYSNFVSNLQKEIVESLASRPRKATKAYFAGKMLQTEDGPIEVDKQMAIQIYHYLIKNDYVDPSEEITSTYHTEKRAESLKPLPEELADYSEQIFKLVDSVFSEDQLPIVDNSRARKKNPLNDNFERAAFKKLWSRINHRAVYRVDFDSEELVKKCISALDRGLHVTQLQYSVHEGVQRGQMSGEQLKGSKGFDKKRVRTKTERSVRSQVEYDILGNLAKSAELTRRTVAKILQGILPEQFEKFVQNPEHFLAETSRLIVEQKATMVIEHLSYNKVEGEFGRAIFTQNQLNQDFNHATEKLSKHIYDYAITDSKVERSFLDALEQHEEVVVYAKLPGGFYIPTPVGNYNPDWAISFEEGSVKHLYFVAETKGSMSSMELREKEKAKIECAHRFFEKISENISGPKINYGVVTNYANLIDIVNEHVSPKHDSTADALLTP